MVVDGGTGSDSTINITWAVPPEAVSNNILILYPSSQWTPVYTGATGYLTGSTFTLLKTPDSGLTAQIISVEGYTTPVYASAKCSSLGMKMYFGITSSLSQMAIPEYAFYCNLDEIIICSPTGQLAGNIYSLTSTYLILYDGIYVSFYIDNVLKYSSPRAVGDALYFNCIIEHGDGINNVAFGKYVDKQHKCVTNNRDFINDKVTIGLNGNAGERGFN